MKKNITKKELKTKSFDEVFKKATTSEKFVKAYNEELVRIRLASEIKCARTKKRLTQGTVAKRANMPQSVIARIESGKHSISLATLNRVANALGKEIQLV